MFTVHFFRQLYKESFPGDHHVMMEEECKATPKSMTNDKNRGAENGILISGGDSGRFAPANRVVLGDGLEQDFGTHYLEWLEFYARGYESTHWSPVLSVLDISPF